MTELENMTKYDLGGFPVSFSAEHNSGSEWVDTGVTSRQGFFLH
jgi:hypothetical protein